MKKFLVLVSSIVISEGAGIIGSIFTTPSIATWYVNLNKPIFNPPNWIFAPVWTTLFLLMGISAYLVWEKGVNKKKVKEALSLYLSQLLLNIAWSVIFFGLKKPLYALLEIIILEGYIYLTFKKFYSISKPAGLLLIPYIAWVAFATFLNFAIVLLN